MSGPSDKATDVAISANYPSPVQVNGFACKNCTDVDNAKKHIDPQHPKSGPYDVNAAADPSRTAAAVSFGGKLAGLNIAQLNPNAPLTPSLRANGAILDVRA